MTECAASWAYTGFPIFLEHGDESIGYPGLDGWRRSARGLGLVAAGLGRVLDPGVVNELAAKTGQDTGSVLGSLSALLPQLVDKATPEGAVEPGQSFNPTDLLASLSGLFGNRG